jgi:three-Cys-motif partner protein
LIFWELETPAEKLKAELALLFPDDERYRVISGDCNDKLEDGLAMASDRQRSPTFAFVDPMGLDVTWTTLEQLSVWRKSLKGRKVELWILFPEPALARVLGLKGVRGESSAERLTRVYGSDDWVAIHQRRTTGDFDAARMRAEFVNLYRWRIQKVLGYRTTHALQLGNVSDHPIYTMIFATDVDAGHSIMQDVYDHALMHEIPQMRAHAVGLRRSKRELEKGIPRLFKLVDDPAPSKNYEHAEPWQPPERLSTPVELDVEPPDEEVEPEEPSDPSDGE